MTTRAQRHARKVKTSIESDADRADRLHREICEIFDELDGYQRYEDACARLATVARDRSRDFRKWLKSHPGEYRRYRERQNALRRARSPFRSEESKRAERERKRAWARANKERSKAWLHRMRKQDPERYALWKRAKYDRDRSQAGYLERTARTAREYYERVKSTRPDRYRVILDRARASNKRRRERIKSDPSLLDMHREAAREYRRRQRARMTHEQRERVRARERELYALRKLVSMGERTC